MSRPFDTLNRDIVECRKCPRLIAYCREVAATRRRAYREWNYWGRPVPNFGDPSARLLIVGLAPAAHGANRTGRMFTGDRSGDWLYRAMHKAGFANQPTAADAGDGLKLRDAAITAVAHCAPPQNKPTREELENCREWLRSSIDRIPSRIYLVLGNLAFRGLVAEVRDRGWLPPRPAPRFRHLGEVELTAGRRILCSYHPSQQNTFTGRLTEPMFDAVFARARDLLG